MKRSEVKTMIQVEHAKLRLKGIELREKNNAEQSEQLKRLREQIALYKHNDEIMSVIRHDIRHYNSALKSLLEKEDTEKALLLLNEISEQQWLITPMNYCENELLNGMLSIYAETVRQHGSKFIVKANLPQEFSMPITDLASLIGNILENAVHAVEKLPPKQGKVSFDMDYQNAKLKLMVKNDCAYKPQFDENGFPICEDTKQGSGIGTHRIADIVKKYGGYAGFSVSGGEFTVKVILHCD